MPEPPPYYAPPGYGVGPAPGASAPVWGYYVAYAVAMALLYLFVLGYGVFMLAMGAGAVAVPTSGDDAAIMTVYGVMMTALGALLMLVFGAAPFLPKKPWAWIYHLILICLGLTSACCAPFSIGLLIYWLKPETKQMFGRS